MFNFVLCGYRASDLALYVVFSLCTLCGAQQEEKKLAEFVRGSHKLVHCLVAEKRLKQ